MQDKLNDAKKELEEREKRMTDMRNKDLER